MTGWVSGYLLDLRETATLGETKRIYHKVTIYSSNLFSPVAFATDCNKLHPIQLMNEPDELGDSIIIILGVMG